MKHRLFALAVGVCLFASAIAGAPAAGTSQPYERIICVVPYIGAGTLNDPKRPMFAPVPGSEPESTKKSKGFVDPAVIISYHSVPADNGALAIVEFVARDRAAFAPILKNPLGLTVLDPHLLPRATLLKRLRAAKQNFDLASFLGGAL